MRRRSGRASSSCANLIIQVNPDPDAGPYASMPGTADRTDPEASNMDKGKDGGGTGAQVKSDLNWP